MDISCCILGAKIEELQKAAAQRRTLTTFDLSHVQCESCKQKILVIDQYVKIRADEPDGPTYFVHAKCLFDNERTGLFDRLANKCSKSDRSIYLKGRSKAWISIQRKLAVATRDVHAHFQIIIFQLPQLWS